MDQEIAEKDFADFPGLSAVLAGSAVSTFATSLVEHDGARWYTAYRHQRPHASAFQHGKPWICILLPEEFVNQIAHSQTSSL